MRTFEWASFYLTLPLHYLYSLYSLFYSVSGLIVNDHNNYRAPPIVENTAMLVLSFTHQGSMIFPSDEAVMRQVFENSV